MDIEKIIGIGISAVLLSVLLKNYRPEISVSISIISCAVMLVMIGPYFKTVTAFFVDLSRQIGIEMQFMIIVVKVIGIAFITQIGAEICKDAGETAIGTNIEICGKIIIIAMSMPVIYRLFDVVGKVIDVA